MEQAVDTQTKLKMLLNFEIVFHRRDTSISVWDASDGKLVRILKGHGHWVNTLALSTEHAMRTGAFDHEGRAPSDPEEAQATALKRSVNCDSYTLFARSEISTGTPT